MVKLAGHLYGNGWRIDGTAFFGRNYPFMRTVRSYWRYVSDVVERCVRRFRGAVGGPGSWHFLPSLSPVKLSAKDGYAALALVTSTTRFELIDQNKLLELMRQASQQITERATAAGVLEAS